MNSLTKTPLAPLLQRLFEQAAAVTSPALMALSNAQREALTRSKTEYRELYGQIKDMWLPVSPETGELLYLLARTCKARHIVEFGTSFGISSIYLAAALRDNGGGQLISTEFETSKIARAQQHLREAGLDELVQIREGDALQTLRHDLPEQIDLVLLDGAKALYNDILDLLEPRLRIGAIIVADNVDYCPEYLARVRDPQHGYYSIACNQALELTFRTQASSASCSAMPES